MPLSRLSVHPISKEGLTSAVSLSAKSQEPLDALTINETAIKKHQPSSLAQQLQKLRGVASLQSLTNNSVDSQDQSKLGLSSSSVLIQKADQVRDESTNLLGEKKRSVATIFDEKVRSACWNIKKAPHM